MLTRPLQRCFVGNGSPFQLFTVCLLLLCASFAAAQDDQAAILNREFQSAVSQYKAGNLPEAAAQLEKLLPRVPESFEAHELLGLIYDAQ
jgi:Tfp pilus assembly protein PilF